MSRRPLIVASLLTILALSLVAFTALGRLPDGTQLPFHWGPSGAPDRFADAATALFMPVFLTIAVALLMAALPAVEPLQDRMAGSWALFRTTWIALLLLMVGIEIVVAAPAFGLGLPDTTIPLMIGMFLIGIGNVLPKSRPGFFLGIRTPWALIDGDNWIATHRVGGWTFMAGGAVMVLGAVVPLGDDARAAVMIAALALATVPPLLYSFLHWQRRKRAV